MRHVRLVGDDRCLSSGNEQQIGDGDENVQQEEEETDFVPCSCKTLNFCERRCAITGFCNHEKEKKRHTMLHTIAHIEKVFEVQVRRPLDEETTRGPRRQEFVKL